MQNWSTLSIEDLGTSPSTDRKLLTNILPIKKIHALNQLKSRQSSFEHEEISTPIQSGVDIQKPQNLPKGSLKSIRKYKKVVIQDEDDLAFL